MIGVQVRSVYHRLEGIIVEHDPLGAGLCDACIQQEDGGRVWVDLSACERVDGLALPSRSETRREADAALLSDLRAIRGQLVEELKGPRWPGMEFGKGHLGMALDQAISDVEKGRDG